MTCVNAACERIYRGLAAAKTAPADWKELCWLAGERFPAPMPPTSAGEIHRTPRRREEASAAPARPPFQAMLSVPANRCGNTVRRGAAGPTPRAGAEHSQFAGHAEASAQQPRARIFRRHRCRRMVHRRLRTGRRASTRSPIWNGRRHGAGPNQRRCFVSGGSRRPGGRSALRFPAAKRIDFDLTFTGPTEQGVAGLVTSRFWTTRRCLAARC